MNLPVRVVVVAPIFGAFLLQSGGCVMPPFDYETHEPPRVSVLHSPIHPSPGWPISFQAKAQLPAGMELQNIRIVYFIENPGQPWIEGDEISDAGLPLQDGEYVYEAPPVAGPAVDPARGFYMASVTGAFPGQDPVTVKTKVMYTFQVGFDPPPPPDDPYERLPLRVPLPLTQLEYEAVYQVILLPHDDSYGDASAFLSAADDFLPSLFEDPAYRWRDHQIGFWAYTQPAQVSDYYSGLSTRCGGKPYPNEEMNEEFPEELRIARAVGVIHNQEEVEEGVAWRDCALGLSAGERDFDGAAPPLHFSAYVNAVVRDRTLRHELGHVLFGLADEYGEGEDTRTAPPGVRGPNDLSCVPCRCGPPGIGPPCFDPEDCHPRNSRPLYCDILELRPKIASMCRLGDFDRRNIFDTEQDCLNAVEPIDFHPGVEYSAANGTCRAVCGAQGEVACPFVEPGEPDEVWKVDYHPGLEDLYGDIMDENQVLEPANVHGPACERCIESRLCLTWEFIRLQAEFQDQEQARENAVAACRQEP